MLEVRGLRKCFGASVAVADVSLEVAAGESVGLIGPNGAGKTTLFDCIGGRLHPDAGRVLFLGRDVTGMAAWRRARLGVGRTYQRVEVYPELTVEDHLLVADRIARGRGRMQLWRDLLGRSGLTVAERDRVDGCLEMVGLADVAKTPVAALGLGTCRLVELARAVAAAPSLLLADEPSSGLDEHETRRISEVLRSLQSARRMSILLVEHDLAMVESAVDRVVVLDLGRVVATGEYADVMAAPAVRRAYLGVP